MEFLVFAIAVAAGAGFLLAPAERGAARAWAPALGLVVIAVVCALSWRPPQDVLAPSLPASSGGDEGYVSSDGCRSCHPGEYHSWHRSFHRTMTQAARPDTVVAPFDGVVLRDRGREYRLSRRDDEFLVDMVDPLWDAQHIPRPQGLSDAQAPRIVARVVLLTGSHHRQTFWVERPINAVPYRATPGSYYRLPFVYEIDAQTWIPVLDAFLRPPPEAAVENAVWNSDCVVCHNVWGKPGLNFQTGVAETAVAELGIGCEACHGPSEEHVRLNRSPLRRYGLHLAGDGDVDTVVNPEKLDHRRASDVCGQCHSVHSSRNMDEFLVTGNSFKPGEELDDSRDVIRYVANSTDPRMLQWLQADPNALLSRFWPDGAYRVAGREFNGLIESPCYQRGTMSCFSCHSLHDYVDRDHQLKPDMGGDEACLQCHEDHRDRVAEHSHHAAGSEGARCMNCHMPQTVYGLLSLLPSHRVGSPVVRADVPNACNLCHLDRTEAWTAGHLEQWYDQPVPQMSDSRRTVAASVRWLWGGDAAFRAVAAWHMGWGPAQQASGTSWQAGHLAGLLTDEIAAVRHGAARSLRTLPGFADLDYDHVAADAARQAAAAAARSRFRPDPADLDPERATRLALDPQRGIRDDLLEELVKHRDRRPLFIIE